MVIESNFQKTGAPPSKQTEDLSFPRVAAMFMKQVTVANVQRASQPCAAKLELAPVANFGFAQRARVNITSPFLAGARSELCAMNASLKWSE